MDKAPNKFMSVVYQLYTVEGEKIELEEQTSTDRPFEFITGFGIALDAFEQQVMKLGKGSAFDFVLQPSEAFGDYLPDGIHKLDRNIFVVNGKFDNENVQEGAIITLSDEEEHQFMAKVVNIDNEGVTVDTNHPLAGKTLNFKGTIIENRDATEEEIQHLIKMLSGGCEGCGGGCGHHGEGEGCGHHGEGCDHHGEGHGGGCGHCHH